MQKIQKVAGWTYLMLKLLVECSEQNDAFYCLTLVLLNMQSPLSVQWAKVFHSHFQNIGLFHFGIPWHLLEKTEDKNTETK